MADQDTAPRRMRDIPPHAILHVQVPAHSYLTQLLGRDLELQQLAELLVGGDARLVTLIGPGGVGKTRLAQELLVRSAGDYLDGAWFVPLAALSDSGMIPGAIARTIGIQARGERPVLDVLSDLLRHRRSLLVLDNMEHLLAGSLAWLVTLLVDCPHLRIVVTSRTALRLTGEQRFPVNPLPLPGARSGVDARDQVAVTLFAQRARSVLPDIELTDREIEIIAEICRRLDGLPLAIELAAARVNVLTPADMLARLSDRFLVLSGGAQDAPARLRSMHDAIAWSYDLLTPDLRRVIRRLSVFVGGFTLDAAVAVAAEPELDRESTERAVAALVDQSLLKRLPAGEGPARFGMLETIREFAASQLDASGETEEMQDRLASWMLALTEELKPAWMTSSQKRAADRLEREHANLRAALAWLSRRDDHRDYLRLVCLVYFYWFVRCHYVEGRRWVDLAMTWSTGEVSRERATILTASNALSWGQHDMGQVVANSAELRSLMSITAPFGSTSIVIPVANAAGVGGDVEEAIRIYQASLDAYARTGSTEMSDQGWAGWALRNLASLKLAQGELQSARRVIEESLALHRASGHTWGLVDALLTSGDIADREGDPRRAKQLYRECLALAFEENDLWQVLEPLQPLAVHAAKEGEVSSAARWLGKVEHLRELIGRATDHRMQANLDEMIDRIRARLGDAAFERVWAEGKALPLETIVAEVCALDAEAGSSAAHRAGITPRELDVLRMVANELTDQQIADALFISRRTVNSHVGNLLAKLQATSRREAVHRAIEHGLLSQDLPPSPYT